MQFAKKAKVVRFDSFSTNKQIINFQILKCIEGFSGDGAECFDIHECLIGLHWCSDTEECVNTVGSYECHAIAAADCDDGYNWDGPTKTCVDIDECKTLCNGTGQVCENTSGSFLCGCSSGYQGDISLCVDINECTDPLVDNCGQNSRCLNTNGSFECECVQGLFQILLLSGSKIQKSESQNLKLII